MYIEEKTETFNRRIIFTKIRLTEYSRVEKPTVFRFRTNPPCVHRCILHYSNTRRLSNTPWFHLDTFSKILASSAFNTDWGIRFKIPRFSTLVLLLIRAENDVMKQVWTLLGASQKEHGILLFESPTCEELYALVLYVFSLVRLVCPM